MSTLEFYSEDMHSAFAPGQSAQPATHKATQDETDLFALERFPVAFAPGPKREELLVFLSSSRTFMMDKRLYSRDALFVATNNSHYYLMDTELLADALSSFIQRQAYGRTLLIGGSKGGFGALLIALLMARLHPDRYYRVLAFGPQVRLFPDDPSLYFPSYRKMMHSAKRNAALTAGLKAFGDVSAIGGLTNLHATIVYGELSKVDCEQAALIQGPNIRKFMIHTDLHNTTLFFGNRTYDEASLRRRLERTYAAPADGDTEATKPPDIDRLVSQILDASWLPTFDTLVDQVMAVNPPTRA